MPVVLAVVNADNGNMRSLVCICGDTYCAIIPGTCHCGCGEKTRLSRQTRSETGDIKGWPRRYRPGHHAVGNQHGLKPRRAPHFETVDGKPCVWISTATGGKHLIDAGDFQKVKDIPWHEHNGYACFRGGQGTIFLHQLILPMTDGRMPDHENGNRWDSRKQNLRPATKQQNGWNAKLSIRNKSGIKGVRLHPCGKYVARIVVGRKDIHLGLFDSKEAAAEARLQAEIKYCGEFRRAA